MRSNRAMRAKVIVLAWLAGCRLFASPGLVDKVNPMIGASKANYTVFFYAQFNKPIAKCGVWSAGIPADGSGKREDIESARYRKGVAAARVLEGCLEKEGDQLGFHSEFATAEGEQVLWKVGLSFATVGEAGIHAPCSVWREFSYEWC